MRLFEGLINKVSAMAAAAEQLGWTTERPDYAEIDARQDVRDAAVFGLSQRPDDEAVASRFRP